MIARALTTFTAALVLTSTALAQQAAPTPRETVGTSGATPGNSAAPAPAPTTAAAPAAAPDSAAAAAPRAVEPVRVDPRDYRIGPEDVLDINVWKNPELSRERVPVRPDGKISHPLINEINVSGLTTAQVKSEIAQRLSQFIENPEVAVVVREIHSPKVSVSGNVRMAGYFELKTPDVTVLDMIAKAQGLNEFADKGNIKVLRRGQNGAIDFKYNDAINGKNGANFIVQPGDVIVVN
jgi:polysaccharide export outer membrane protein